MSGVLLKTTKTCFLGNDAFDLQEPPMRTKALLFITGRNGILLFNSVILCLSVFSLWISSPMLLNAVDNIADLENVSESLGVILIAYGVAIEERHSLMPIFKLYPKYHTEKQDYIDDVCHAYGLFYLLLGLFMEMCVACVKMPNSIIDTDHIEYLLFGTSAVFIVWNTILMFRHCYLLFHAPERYTPSAH
jgi:hypothetical protein